MQKTPTNAFAIGSLIALLLIPSFVMAQQGGGGGANPFARIGPEMEKLRKLYKHNTMLQEIFWKLIEVEKKGKAALTPEQAKKILDVITPLRKKPKLKGAEAKETIKKIQSGKSALTVKQLNAMDRVKLPQRGGRGGGRGSGNRRGGGGFGAQGGSGGGGFNIDAMLKRMKDQMKDRNPFYMPNKPATRPGATKEEIERVQSWHNRGKKRLDDAFALLEAKAKS